MDNKYQSKRSFWEDELYHQTYDVVIIGAGLTGLSTAYFTKKMNPNARILLLERGLFPIGASTRNAGFACIGTIGEHLADLEIEAKEIVKSRIKDRFEGLQLLKSVVGEQAIDYDACGGWEIFTDVQKFESAHREVDRFNDWMEDLIGEKEVYKPGEIEGYPAIFNRVEGALHPGKMIRQLINLNVQAGVEIRWQAEVQNVDLDNGRIQLRNGMGISGEHIVLATNAFTAAFSEKSKVTPGRGYVFVTQPLSALKWKSTFHYDKGYIYFRNLGEDRLLIGGARNVDYDTEKTNEFGINANIKKYLIDFVNTVIRLPEDWKIDREWSGIMGFTESKSPTLEKIGAKTWQVAGLSGMGVALGMALGRKAASQLAI